MFDQEYLKTKTGLAEVDVEGLGPKISGKVREAYLVEGRRILITTDRVSAFDSVLGVIPFKGQVLNRLTNWWFEKTQDLVQNHLIESPHPNVAVVKNAVTLPVEVVVRAFITGTTKTSLWMLYSQGVDKPYGLDLPAGLNKNDPLPEPVITPTSKGGPGERDERLTCDEVLARGLVEPALWEEAQRVALELFQRGQQVARRAGVILVDTKYEFGLIGGQLTLIDEVHTPDSSRYWLDDGSHAPRDKEMLRLWLASQGYRGEGQVPKIPADKAAELSFLYGDLFERLTGEEVYEPNRSLDKALEKYRSVGV